MNFKKIRKRALAILISLSMVAPYVTPMVAMAADDEDTSFDASYFENAASGSNSTIKMSSGSISSLQSQLGTAIAMQVTSTTSSSSTTLASIDDISDIEVGLTANPDSYRWTAWYRKNAEDELDTSSSSGNYYGFSLDKVKAWSEYSEEIKNLNDGKFPELQDYTYPTTTADGNLSFWADKPGVYDVYGDPHYSQVVLTAKVEVTYTTETQETKLRDNTNSTSGAMDEDAASNLAGVLDGVTGTSDSNNAIIQAMENEICTQISNGKTGNKMQAQYKELKKQAKKVGISLNKDFSSWKKAVKKCKSSGGSGGSNKKATINYVGDNGADVYGLQNGAGEGYSFGDILGETGKQIGILVSGVKNGKIDTSTNNDTRQNECQKLKSEYAAKKSSLDSNGKKTYKNSIKLVCGKNNYQPQTKTALSLHIKKDSDIDLGESSSETSLNGKSYYTVTSQSQHTRTITIAQTVIEDVYGSQLERVGTVAVGEKVNTWNMDSDSFWQTSPDYYSQDTDYLTVEQKDSDNAFDTKEIEYDDEGNEIESSNDSSSSSSGDISSNILLFGFARESDSDVIDGEVTFTNLTVKQNNLVHGYNTIPNSNASIDASIDVNNAGSKYQGKIPLVNFSVTSGETTQTSNSSLKKYVILTQDNEEATNSNSAKNEVKDTETSTKTSHSTKTTQQDGKTIITDVTTKVTTIGDKANTSQTSN